VAHLLLTFCISRPPGVAIGRYSFDSNHFAWLENAAGGILYEGAQGICAHDGEYYVLVRRGLAPDWPMSLAIFDSKLRLRAQAPLELVRDGHSLIYDKGGFLAVSTLTDEIIRIEWSGDGRPKEEPVWAASSEHRDTYHLNSILRHDGRLYVSSFGPKPKAGWEESSSGTIVELASGATIDGLMHPHTLFLCDRQVHVLDSRAGSVLRLDFDSRTATERWRLSGYLRGVARSGEHLYVAASAQRQTSKSTGQPRRTGASGERRCLLHRISLATGEIETRDLSPFGLEVYDIEVAPPLPFETTREDALRERLKLYDTARERRDEELIEAARWSAAYDAELYRLINEDRNFLSAAFALERLLARNASNAHWQYHYGICLLNLGAAERAAVHFENALAGGYSEYWSRYHLASAHFSSGRLEQALDELMRVDAIRPDEPGVATLREWIHAAMRKRADANSAAARLTGHHEHINCQGLLE
jgi:hypothetical protein